MHTFTTGSETPQLTPVLIVLSSIPLSFSASLHMHFKALSELPPNHLAASCAPQNCSPRSALTWEDWLQAAACSSREQAWRRALGGNNFTRDPPLPRPQHELRTGFRKREEKHRVNQRRRQRRGQGKAGGGGDKKGKGLVLGERREGGCKEEEEEEEFTGWKQARPIVKIRFSLPL